MKKLMIAAAIVCAAVMTQAAQIKWGNGTTSKVVGLDGSTALTAANAGAYNFAISLIAAADDSVVQTLSGSSAINSMSAGVLATSAAWAYTFNTDATTGNAFYILATMTVDGKDYEMKIDNAGSNWAIAATDNTGKDTFTWAAGTYGGLAETATVGKWSAAAVPEPTSGLLLLLGIGAMALRRRRA